MLLSAINDAIKRLNGAIKRLNGAIKRLIKHYEPLRSAVSAYAMSLKSAIKRLMAHLLSAKRLIARSGL